MLEDWQRLRVFEHQFVYLRYDCIYGLRSYEISFIFIVKFIRDLRIKISIFRLIILELNLFQNFSIIIKYRSLKQKNHKYLLNCTFSITCSSKLFLNAYLCFLWIYFNSSFYFSRSCVLFLTNSFYFYILYRNCSYLWFFLR